MPTFLFFVDFRKAFDTVWRDGLFKRLWDGGVQGKAWRVVRALYSDIRSAVKVGDRTSRYVQVHQGVRQGCPLSPTLFNCFIDELAESLTRAGMDEEAVALATRWLKYADDVLLLAESADNLQLLVDTIDELCQKWRLVINLKKIQAMTVSSQMNECSCSCKCNELAGNNVYDPPHLVFVSHVTAVNFVASPCESGGTTGALPFHTYQSTNT
jgi:hypothetical protein